MNNLPGILGLGGHSNNVTPTAMAVYPYNNCGSLQGIANQQYAQAPQVYAQQQALGMQNYQAPAAPPIHRKYDFDSAGMAPDLETCALLWVTRFGDGWVKYADIYEDEIYSVIHERLNNQRQMEVLITAQACRIKK